MVWSGRQQKLTMVELKKIWKLLEQVYDPEIPVLTVVDLGVIREIKPYGEGVEVVITPTYSGCPAMGQIEDDVRNLLNANGLQGRVVTQLAPAWTTDWITQEAKDKLRAYGIAPPHSGADHDCLTQGNTSIVQFAARSASNPGRHELLAVPCPQCDSENTTETSHFGSTACKALYRCLDCMEPFDYFKPY